MTRVRGKSISQTQEDEELVILNKQFEFIIGEFKHNIQDVDSIISLLRARLSAEDIYITALTKVKKATSIYESDKASARDSQLSFQQAVRIYEASVYDLIEGRQNVRESIKKELDKLILLKEHEEATRKTCKTKLSEANLNYATFRNRDIVKLQRSYTHRCEELKLAQITYQQQVEQAHPVEEIKNDNTNQKDVYRLSGEADSIKSVDSMEQGKKGMAGLFSQMRTIANGAYLAPVDQSKQMTKVAKIKKDITNADIEYRDGILILENLRRKQRKALGETDWQIKNVIKMKTESIKSSLVNVILSEIESLRTETEKTTASYSAAMNIDSHKDIQVYTTHHQSLGYNPPTPVRYENYYLEGKCKEVLFGGSLESYAIEHNRPIPILVRKCIEALESMGGLQKEGIYRVSGRQTSIEQLKHQFELDEELTDLNSNYDLFTIATVLKSYFRELKRPLFDFNVQSRLAYSKTMPQEQRFGLLEMKLSTLSFSHRSTLHCLVHHLSNVNSNSHLNKMNIQNLALIFTPVIFHDFNQIEEATTGEWSPEDLFEDLILYHEMLFPISEEKAKRINENKLCKAMKGESPYSQFSQSNLLYIAQPTQDMTVKPSASSSIVFKQPEDYPPKLTTIIGAPHQQKEPSSITPHGQNHLDERTPVDNSSPTHVTFPQGFVGPSFLNQEVQGRATSGTVTLKRGLSLSRKKRNSKNAPVTQLSRAHSYSPAMKPQGLLLNQNDPVSIHKTRYPQYKPELYPENILPNQEDSKFKGDSK